MSELGEEQPTFASSLGLSFLLLGLVCFVGWGLVRFLGRRTTVVRNGIRVVCRVSIGPRRSVLFLEAGGRGFLLGSAEDGISVLAEMDPRVFESGGAGHSVEARVEAINPVSMHQSTNGDS
jgi:flagellar biogenesis protein FliO